MEPGQPSGSQPDQVASERREFFRIQDCIGLEVRHYPQDDSRDDPFDGDHLAGLRSELKRLDQDVRANLATLSERDRLLSSLVKSLNSKLDTLARIITFEQNPLQPEDWQQVTLSEGGIAFRAKAGRYRPGQRLAIRMTLPPELYRPDATAEVLDVTPAGQGQELVHAEFTTLHDSDRQEIAKHVMRWQIRQRQQE